MDLIGSRQRDRTLSSCPNVVNRFFRHFAPARRFPAASLAPRKSIIYLLALASASLCLVWKEHL
jgi:hypothetical protein